MLWSWSGVEAEGVGGSQRWVEKGKGGRTMTCLLFPNGLSKLNKAVPPFQMMNDGLKYITQCTILDAWVESVGSNLQEFISSKPTLEEINQHAEEITRLHFETKQDAMNQWL